MPYKRKSDPEDYPTRTPEHNGDWVRDHITENMRQALGEEAWGLLEEMEEEEK